MPQESAYRPRGSLPFGRILVLAAGAVFGGLLPAAGALEAQEEAPVREDVLERGDPPGDGDLQLRRGATDRGELLDGMVITAVGERRTRELGHAVAEIAAPEGVEAARTVNLTGLIQGRATGVNIQRSGGTVGSGAAVKLRGTSSMALDNTPLVIVDGAFVDQSTVDFPFFTGGQSSSRLNDINPEEIEEIEIVKGSAATALYGARAASGVIRITTKRGVEGGTEYRLRGEVGSNRDVTAWPVVGYNPTDDFAADLSGLQDLGVKDTTYLMNLLEDDRAPHGVDGPFRTGFRHAYGLQARGGADFVDYFVSGEFSAEEGNLPSNHQDELRLRANVGFSPGGRVDVSLAGGFRSGRLLLPQNDNNALGTMAGALVHGAGFFMPIRRSDPGGDGFPLDTCPLAFELARTGMDSLEALTGEFCDSPFLLLDFDDTFLQRSTQSVRRFTGSATLDYSPGDFWDVRLTLGFDGHSGESRSLTPDVSRLVGFFDAFEGRIRTLDARKNNITLDGVTTFSYDLGGSVSARSAAGAQWVRTVDEWTTGFGRAFPEGASSLERAAMQEVGAGFGRTRTAGLFFQQRLAYRDLFFLTPSVRFDDSSAFGEELGLSTYPTVSASFVAGELDLFPDFFDEVRIRAAWGRAGNLPRSSDTFMLRGLAPGTLPGPQAGAEFLFRPRNPELGPERVEEWDVGFDVTFLDGRLSTEFTWFRSATTDALVAVPQPSDFFLGEWENVGEMKNRGVELGVDAAVFDRPDLSLDVRVRATYVVNLVTRLDDPIVFGFGGSQRHQEELPFGSFFLPPVELDENRAPFLGDPRFQGRRDPPWDGSVAATLRMFDRVTLFAQTEFQAGHVQLNQTRAFRCSSAFGTCAERLETRGDGELTDRAIRKRVGAFLNLPTPFIQSAGWLKLRTASARFDLPGAWADALGARRASLTVTGENLATFTRYDGVDPELNTSSAAQAISAEFLTVPPARRVLATLSVTF